MGIFGKIFRRKKGDAQSSSKKSKKQQLKEQQQEAAKEKLNTSSGSVLQDSALNTSAVSTGSRRGDAKQRRTSPTKASSATRTKDGRTSSAAPAPTAAPQFGGQRSSNASQKNRILAGNNANIKGADGPSSSSASLAINPSHARPQNGYPSKNPQQQQQQHSAYPTSPQGWGGSTSSVSVEQAASPQFSQSPDENVNYPANKPIATTTNAAKPENAAPASTSASARLSAQELRKWDQQHQHTSKSHHHHHQHSNLLVPAPNPSGPVYRMTMGGEIPKQQMFAMDDMERSDASSSSFNLSTDAEDSEYEALRKRGVIPMGMLNATLDSSIVSGTTYNTENDPIFPALQTDDEMTLSTAQSSARDNPPRIMPVAPLSMASMLGQPEQSDAENSNGNGNGSRSRNINSNSHRNSSGNAVANLHIATNDVPATNATSTDNVRTPTSASTGPSRLLSDDLDEPGRIHLAKMTHESEEDFRAWTISPSASSTTTNTTPREVSLSNRNGPNRSAMGQVRSPTAGSLGDGNIANNTIAAHNVTRSAVSPLDSGKTDPHYVNTSVPRGDAPGVTSPAQKFFGATTPSKGLTINSRNTPNGPVRNFTSPKSHASSEFSYEDEFQDFADFGAFGTSPFDKRSHNRSIMSNSSKRPSSATKHHNAGNSDADSFSEHKTDTPDALMSGKDDSFQNYQMQQQQQQLHVMQKQQQQPQYPQQQPQPQQQLAQPRQQPSNEFGMPAQAEGGDGGNGIKFVNNEGLVAASVPEEKSLSELLAQAKNKSRTRSSRRGKTSSASVSSAPALTASHLRQQHNLKSYNGSSRHSSAHMNAPGSDGSAVGGSGASVGHKSSSSAYERGETTSVSDIISSLEATNQSRLRNAPASGYRASSHRSVGDVGAVSTARTMKERMREKRRRERDNGRLHRSKSSEVSSSENSDNDQDDQDWLIDGVTGALGPRGIAADLESLSGRSKSSTGNRSHKSHKSHRSHKSRSRARSSRHHHHKASSGESVDSRGSRHSRSSRYSHKSTKSYISQMSEQSRSVANDLLRLEMQLAMVGSSNAPGGGEESMRGPSSIASSRLSSHHHTRSSRDHRKSRGAASSTSSVTSASTAASRRTKMTVRAPPGKLGIILANKADSKGTVVSGVRTSSVLASKIVPGDRIIAIDGEDVSRMTVSEITTIMARKSDFERTLTVLTVPRKPATSSASTATGHTSSRSSQSGSVSASGHSYDGYSQYRSR